MAKRTLVGQSQGPHIYHVEKPRGEGYAAMWLPLTFPIGAVNKECRLSVLEQDTEDLIVPFSGSQVQSRVSPAVQKAQVSPNPQQVLHHIFLLGDYGQVQRCLGERTGESLVGRGLLQPLASESSLQRESSLGRSATPD